MNKSDQNILGHTQNGECGGKHITLNTTVNLAGHSIMLWRCLFSAGTGKLSELQAKIHGRFMDTHTNRMKLCLRDKLEKIRRCQLWLLASSKSLLGSCLPP